MPVPQLLSAVVAAGHPLALICYDAAVEIAAEVLAFEHRWVVHRGGVHWCRAIRRGNALGWTQFGG